MKRPFKFIESKTTARNEFQMTDGVQPTCALFYLKAGSFSLTIDGKMTCIQAGDLVIFPDYVPFRRHVTAPIVFVYIKFAIEPGCTYVPPIPYGKIELGPHRERILANFDMFEQLRESTDQHSLLLREHLLEDTLLLLSATHQSDIARKPTTISDPLVLLAVKYIEEHIAEELSLQNICQTAKTNASTLNFRFHRVLGMSAGAYIIEARMRLARQLLLTTTFSVGEIATRCGYENIYYFSTAFKKWAGISPSSLRNEVFSNE